MVVNAHQVRDLRTVGPLLPEARTTVFKLPGSDIESVDEICVGKRFLCLAAGSTVSLFATDGTSPVMADPTPSMSNKKASTAITGGRQVADVATLNLPSAVVSVNLCFNERFLIIFATSGVFAADLSRAHLETVEVLKSKSPVEAGTVVSPDHDSCLIVFGTKGAKTVETRSLKLTTEGTIEASDFKLMLPKFGSAGEWKLHSLGKMLAVSHGADSVVLVKDVFASKRTVHETKLAGIDVLSLHCIAEGTLATSAAFGPEAAGLVVVQPDVISVYTDKDEELELIFQFRDAINKVSFSTVDVTSNFLVSVSSDSFSGRDRLELFDLSFLKLKSAALQPLRRWDISRLLTHVDEPLVAFTNGEFLSFVLSGPNGTAVLWEPVVRDQWFSVMANFEVLNKNEPYAEAEEEFDFNQSEDLSVVKTTINRYKRTERTTFNFVTDQTGSNNRTSTEDVDMTGYPSENRLETVYPFLQPIESWTGDHKPVAKCGSVGGAHTEFFSASARQMLAKHIGNHV